MTEHARFAPPFAAAAADTTPAGLQSAATLRRRRMTVLALNVATYAALAGAMAAVVGAGGWTIVDLVLFACFLVATPWTVLGFWNAAIGLWLLHGRADGVAAVAPFAGAAHSADPIRLRTAVLMTLRNEDPARAFLRLRTVKASLEATGEGEGFAYFILSDTSSPAVAAAEEAAVAAWRSEVRDPDAHRLSPPAREHRLQGRQPARLLRNLRARLRPDAAARCRQPDGRRRRSCGSCGSCRRIRGSAFCRASSSARRPTSAFARIFQFGMRHGMRAYTFGSAWWTGDCGPFWGHNAVVRIAPFRDHCDLPMLPGKPPLGGHVLSHDQVEATLMRRAGYEVRVLPEEGGSWEDNPPTMLEFSARDLRWCQGNMQYWRLLGTAGPPVHEPLPARLGDPDVPRRAGDDADDRARPAEDSRRRGPCDLPGRARDRPLSDLPRHVSCAEARRARRHPAREGRRRALRRRSARFLASAAIEIVFSFLLGAVTTFRITLFMIGLLFGSR